jgi:hypothetical protein
MPCCPPNSPLNMSCWRHGSVCLPLLRKDLRLLVVLPLFLNVKLWILLMHLDIIVVLFGQTIHIITSLLLPFTLSMLHPYLHHLNIFWRIQQFKHQFTHWVTQSRLKPPLMLTSSNFCWVTIQTNPLSSLS